MGMDLYLNTKIITNDEYEKLKKEKLYINKYDLELLSREDIENEKKTFFFNLLSFIIENDGLKDLDDIIKQYNDQRNYGSDLFFNFLENKYEDILDYVMCGEDKENLLYYDESLDDYIPYSSWVNGDDFCEGDLKRDEQRAGDSVILIQALYC